MQEKVDIVITHQALEGESGGTFFATGGNGFTSLTEQEAAAIICEGFCPCHIPNEYNIAGAGQGRHALDGKGYCPSCFCTWTVQIKERIEQEV